MKGRQRTRWMVGLLGGCALAAQAQGPTAGLAVGSSGLSVEAGYPLSPNLGVRGLLSGWSFSRDFSDEQVEYQGDLDLSTAGAVLDWHPVDSGFRITTGLFLNDNRLTGRAEGEIELDGITYPELGLEAEADWGRVAPYFGVGYGNSWGSRGWSFGADVGLLVTGSPSVSVVASGDERIVEDERFLASLERERLAVEDELSELDLYPVVRLGAFYRF